MASANNFKKRLVDKEVLIIDGAMGSEIQRRGVSTKLPLWSAEALLTNPMVVEQIHEDYIRAGADIITTNTFSTTERVFRKNKIGNKSKEATILACSLAINARTNCQATKKVYIAGSVTPLEDCYSPELTPPQVELEAEHKELAENLKQGGVDFLLLETMITIRETLAAIQAAKQTGLAFAVSFCCNDKFELLSGESLKKAIRSIQTYNPLFVSVNCVSVPVATNTMSRLKDLSPFPIGVYAQGEGEVNDNDGWVFRNNLAIQDYPSNTKRWLNDGAQLIGGCCGTSPMDIAKIRKLIML